MWNWEKWPKEPDMPTTRTTPQHTPTPWAWETWDGDERVFIYTGDSTTELQPQPIILRGPDKITNVERAKQIVSDHNTHAALVEALEAVHARRIAWPKEIEEKVTAALAAAKGTK